LAYFRGPQANSARPSDIETSAFNVVANNMVVHNNRPNIAVAGDVAAALVLVPSGILEGAAFPSAARPLRSKSQPTKEPMK
jgi:hypothetical protein